MKMLLLFFAYELVLVVCGVYSSFCLLLENIHQIGDFCCDGRIGRSAKGVGFGVSVHVREAKEVAAFYDKVADTCF